MVDKKCEWCGEIFKVVPYKIKIGGGKYCSRKCYYNFMRMFPNKGAYKKGHKGCTDYWKNKKRSIETKLKISNSLWRGGEKESSKRRYNKSRKNNLKYQLNCRMRGGFHRTLKKGIKNERHWEDLVPYNYKQLKKHLQKTLPENYNWNDFLKSNILHIDHIRPISSFKFNKPGDLQFQQCWALENLQLLPKNENLKKGDKLIKSFQMGLAV